MDSVADATPQEWTVLSETERFSGPSGLSLSTQSVRLPDGKVIDDYHRIRLPDFTAICARTYDNRILVLRQYKHGVGRQILTLPGGAVDPGETPLESAQRELLEETGYEAPIWTSLGRFVVNGNQRIAEAHLFMATAAQPVREPDSGDLETMTLERMTLGEMGRLFEAGEFPILAHASLLALTGVSHGVWDPRPRLSN